MKVKDITSQISVFFESPAGKMLSRWTKRLFFAGILVWLGYELTKVGWLNVWKSLPAAPLFYVIFLLAYFQLPLFEIWIYRLTWSFDAIKSIPTFIIKRVYNKDVMGYSGELYFYVWAKKMLSLPDKELMTTIKDNNVISSVASTMVSAGLLSIFVFTGQVKLSDWFTYDNIVYWSVGGFLAVLLAALGYQFRNYVIHMPWKTAFSIFGIQTFRLVFVQVLNILMFYAVMPDTPLYVWFTYLSVEIILSRIPLVPNKDFVFVSLSIGLAGSLQVSESEIAALMLTRSVLGKILNFGFFGLFNLYQPKDVQPGEVEKIEELADADYPEDG